VESEAVLDWIKVFYPFWIGSRVHLEVQWGKSGADSSMNRHEFGHIRAICPCLAKYRGEPNMYRRGKRYWDTLLLLNVLNRHYIMLETGEVYVQFTHESEEYEQINKSEYMLESMNAK
jgi:hypothetical protein